MRFLLPLAALISATPLEATISFKQTDDRLRVEIDGELFTEYRTDQAVPYLYPVISPSGAGLSRQFPLEKAAPGEQTDHPHHTSIWFTHGLVNGVDFWARHLKQKGRILHKGFGEITSQSSTVDGVPTDTLTFSVDLSWSEGETVHLLETRSYTITARGKTRTIDMDSTLKSPGGEVLFGDTKEGSAAIRLTPTLRAKGKVAKGSILNSEGDRGKEAWGKRAKWVAYSGPDGSGEPAVVAMFDHPENLRHPTWWHARDYGLLAANPFGRHDFENKKDAHLGDYLMKPDDSLRFRYRVLLHHGDLESASVAKEWEEYGGN